MDFYSLLQIVSEKLKKNSYQAWKFRISNFLMGKGCWDFITSDEQKPALLDTSIVAQVQTLKIGIREP